MIIPLITLTFPATNALQQSVTILAAKPVEEWNMWIDRVCIDQGSTAMKSHVTTKFADYVQRSEAIVIVLSPSYFTRLWCVFEFRFCYL